MSSDDFVAPIGWMRVHGKVVDDNEVRRVLTTLCAAPETYQIPTDVAAGAASRLSRDADPRPVARWLLDECELVGSSATWVFRSLLAED